MFETATSLPPICTRWQEQGRHLPRTVVLKNMWKPEDMLDITFLDEVCVLCMGGLAGLPCVSVESWCGRFDATKRCSVVVYPLFFCLPLKRCPRVVNRPPPLLCFACPHRLQLKEDLEPEFARYGTVHRMVVYDTNPEAVVTVEVTRGTELRFGEL